jgi:hypothetical protein
MNAFTSALARPAIKPITARTTNGMRARSTTSNANVDLFGSIAAMRGKDVLPAFTAAYAENKDYALRIAQWARDVRSGAGERKIYRDILVWLEQNDRSILLESRLLDNLAEIGRFDDLLIFTNAQVKQKAYSIIARALDEGNGLAAKWMPRKGPIAVELRKTFDLTPKQYRKILVELTNVVETQMCAKNWNEINFSHVPSQAMTKYLTAFHRNAPEEMAAYKAALVRNDGTAKVNAGAVYPHDVTKMLGGAKDLSGYGGYGRSFGYTPFSTGNLPVAQAMWDALPDFMNDANVLSICDNSGSMQSQVPGSQTAMLDVAASLTMYTAQKSKGAFKDLSIGFSDTAAFCKHSGSLVDRLTQVCSMPWGGSTNLHSAFKLILDHATSNNVPAEDMPKIVVIFSDMQFNVCRGFDDSAQQMIRRKFEDAGYEAPAVVFWNLNEKGNKPVKFNDQGVALVSGFSPSLMKSILAADLDKFSPEAIMLATIGNDRYSW